MNHIGTWRGVSSQTRRWTRSTCMQSASARPTQRSQHSHATLEEEKGSKKKTAVTKCDTRPMCTPLSSSPPTAVVIPEKIFDHPILIQSQVIARTRPVHAILRVFQAISLKSASHYWRIRRWVSFLGLGLRPRDRHA